MSQPQQEENKNGAQQQGDPNQAGQPGQDAEEEQKKDKEEEYVSIGRKVSTQKWKNSVYTPPQAKTTEKYDVEEKKVCEMVRRWKVVIEDIEITNLSNQLMNPFIRFTVGGDFHIEIKELPDKKKVFLPQGVKGVVQVTDVIRYLEPSDSSMYNWQSNSEIKASYFELLEQHLHIEVWNYNRMFLNTFVGYESILLHDLADGPVNQRIEIFEKMESEGDNKNLKCAIQFKVVFEEIWDFLLKFTDWRSSSLENELSKKQVNPQILIELNSRQSIRKEVKSETLKNQKLPYWSQVGEGIIFRGTYLELQNQMLSLTVKTRNALAKTSVIGQKNINLAGCLDSQVETKLQIYKDKKAPEFQQATLKGTIQIALMPRYRQVGETQSIRKNLQYLVVHISKINAFEALSDSGDPSVWATVGWGGFERTSQVIKRSLLNETFYFQLAISEQTMKQASKGQLADIIFEELRTKPEISISVWADTGSGQIESLGANRMCLRSISNAKFVDRSFTDGKTREKVDFQTRVHYETLRLTSAFQQRNISTVELQVWFQNELPYPEVDIGSLKPANDHVYPIEFENLLVNSTDAKSTIQKGKLFKKWKYILEMNDQNMFQNDRNLLMVEAYTSDKRKHLLPTFISKIASAGTNSLLAQENEMDNLLLNTLVASDQHEAKLARGIRTLEEVAHYVRCIPFTKQQAGLDHEVLCTPKTLLTRNLGSVGDHAILMANMFRAVRYETQAEVQEMFKKLQQKKDANKQKAIDKLINKAGLNESSSSEESAEASDEESGTYTGSDSQTGSESASDANESSSYTESSISSGVDTNRDAAPQQSKSALSKILEGTKNALTSKKEELESSTVEDRVFVCIGKYKDSKGAKVAAYWVMTLDSNWLIPTFWDCVQHQQYELRGRIKKDETANLQAYLRPGFLTKEQKQEIETINKWKDDVLSDSSDEELKVDEIEAKISSEEDEQSVHKNVEGSSIEERESDLSFINKEDIMVYHEDLNQNLKGLRPDLIGKKIQLSKEQKAELHKRDAVCKDTKSSHSSVDSESDEDENVAEDNEFDFFKRVKQEQKRREENRADKHLLPVERFFDTNGKKVKPIQLPFQDIDLIFNHKNIWSNMQNNDPAHIYYHLHNETQWLPLVRDDTFPHPHEPQYARYAKWLRHIKKEQKGTENPKLRNIDYRARGDFMKQFQTFYSSKTFSRRMDAVVKKKVETNLVKRIENAIKQVRSSQNNSTIFKWSPTIKTVLSRYLDFMEDDQTGRIYKNERAKLLLSIEQDLKSLVPVDYRIHALPVFLSYTDEEKVTNTVSELGKEFCSYNQGGVTFSVNVNIYPFQNGVNSVRIVILRMQKNIVGQVIVDQKKGDKSQKIDKQPKKAKQAVPDEEERSLLLKEDNPQEASRSKKEQRVGAIPQTVPKSMINSRNLKDGDTFVNNLMNKELFEHQANKRTNIFKKRVRQHNPDDDIPMPKINKKN